MTLKIQSTIINYACQDFDMARKLHDVPTILFENAALDDSLVDCMGMTQGITGSRILPPKWLNLSC